MNQEIKLRIDDIKACRVPQGYKKTSCGVLPCEWAMRRLYQIFDRNNTRNANNVVTNVLTISAQQGLISQTNYFNKDIASEDRKNYLVLKKDSFAYNKSYSTGYPFGAIKRLKYYDTGILSPLYICFDHKKDLSNIDFFEQYFESGAINHQINNYAQEGARNHGLLNLSIEDFFNSQLALPPLAEQNKIAEILATWDRAIEKQSKLIQNLEKRKKFLMHKLFEPKEAWEKTTIGQIGKTTGSSVDKLTKIEEQMVELLNYKDVYKCKIIDDDFDNYLKVSATKSQISNYEVKFGDVLFTPSSETAIDIGKSAVFMSKKKNVLYSYHLVRLSFTKKIDDYYKAYMFLTFDILKQFAIKAIGPIRFVISASEFEKTILHLPPFEYQVKIGKILTNADKIIEMHTKELYKLKLQKKSLMQLLLSGIVRVNGN